MVDAQILGFQEGYNERLLELIADRGLPRNSQKAFLVPADRLVSAVQQSSVRITPGQDAVHADGRRVAVDEEGRIVVSAGDWTEYLHHRGPVTVVWGPDSDQLFLGEWRDGALVYAHNIRNGMSLQAVFVCSESCANRSNDERSVHLHD